MKTRKKEEMDFFDCFNMNPDTKNSMLECMEDCMKRFKRCSQKFLHEEEQGKKSSKS